MLNLLSFLRGALPWILMAVPVAILAANGMGAKDERKAQRIALGAALGLLLGTALNSAQLWDSHALGFSIGPLWGIALAAMWKERNTESGAE